MLTDTHSHIYLEEFDADRDEVVARSLRVGVSTIFMPNVDSSTIERMHQAEDRYSCCKSMMGLHPTSVKENWREELAIIQSALFSRKYVGVGEIGIDLYWDKTFLSEQKEVFTRQIQWAIELDLPIAVHCRDAFAEAFDVVDQCYTPKLRGVFHSFSGGKEELSKLASYKTIKAGISGMLTFKNSQLRNFIGDFDPGLFVVETDAPYLSPVPHRGRRNEPSYVVEVAAAMATVFNLSDEQMNDVLEDNVKAIFG